MHRTRVITAVIFATAATVLPLASMSTDAHAQSAPARAARATISGRISMKPEPARRIANRYAGATAPGTEQQLPVIVYLRGQGLPPAQIPARAPEMAQHDTAFSPALLVVGVGTTVQFRNQDPFYHNVFSYSKPKRFDLGRFPKPEAKPVSFTRTGTVDVFCEIHRSMHGVILITDNDYHTEAAPDGSYSLRDVPAGHYELVVWRSGHGEKVVPVNVPASGVLTVNASF
jgi:plastocyanin